jgi:hypothetical protein
MTLRPGQRLWRIHRAGRPCWHFSRGSGRFDPVAAPGLGACYWGRSDLAAWVEKMRTTMLLNEADLDELRLACVELKRRLRLADCTRRAALTAGVTAALSSAPDYALSQQLASALATRLDGVLYFARHDPAQRLRCVAIFGPAGSQPRRRPTSTSGPIPRALRRRAQLTFGYRVLPVVGG